MKFQKVFLFITMLFLALQMMVSQIPVIRSTTAPTMRYGCNVQSASWSSTVGYFSTERMQTFKNVWGFNTLHYDSFWCAIERDYYQPQVYYQPALDNLRTMADRAIAEGIEVVISFFWDYGTPSGVRAWWDGWASHDYVNEDAGWVNHDWDYGDDAGSDGSQTADIWATGGRARYGEFIEDMAEFFDDCIICVCKFPYHGQSASTTEKNLWSETSFPYFLERVRTTSNVEPVVFVPVHQSVSNYNFLDQWFTDSYGVILGWGHGTTGTVSYGQGNWDYDYASRDAYFAPIQTFRDNFPYVDIMSVEYGGLSTPQSSRPPSQSRLDCLDYCCEWAYNLSSGWLYHCISWRVGSDTLLLYQPNSDTFVADPAILEVLQFRMWPPEPAEFLAWTCGFETGDLTVWDSSSGLASVTSTQYYNGSYSANLTAVAGGGGGWLSGWDKRVKLTVDYTDFGVAVTNYPLYVHICAVGAGKYDEDVSFIFDEVGANSKKIAVTTSDGTTECYVDLDYWDASAECSRFWVKVPSISNTSDTDIYLYYDNDHADNTAYVNDSGVGNSVNVWDADFMMVQHFSGASATAIDDSSSNNNDVASDTGSPAYNQAGQMAKAVDLEGDNPDYLTVADDDTLDGFDSFMTLEGWVKLESIANPRAIYGKYKTSTNERSYYFFVYDSTNLQVAFSSAGDQYVTYRFTGQTYSVGVWYYFVWQWEADEVPRAWCNGIELTAVQNSKSEPDWTTSTINNGAEDLLLGYNIADGSRMDGLIDEYRMSNVSRTDWIAANYEVCRDQTVDFHGEETGSGGGASAKVAHTTVAMTELYMRSFVRFEDLPDSDDSAVKVLEFQTLQGVLIGNVMVYRNQSLNYWLVQVGGETWNEGNKTQSTIAADTWYSLELYFNATANGNVTLWVNEALKCENTGDYSGLGSIRQTVLYSYLYGTHSANRTVYHDTFEVNDQRIYGGVGSSFFSAYVHNIMGDVPIPNVLINGTYTTNANGFYEFGDLPEGNVCFIVEKPGGYYPAWILNVDGSFGWNTTHYTIQHNVTMQSDGYVKIFFSTSSDPYINYTNAKITEASFTKSYLLELTLVHEAGGSITNVHSSGNGNATYVYNSTAWDYDAEANIVEVNVTHPGLTGQTVELSWGFIATHTLEMLNSNYEIYGLRPYLMNSDGLVTALSSTTSTLSFTVQGTGATRTDVYTRDETPQTVTGAHSYIFDATLNHLNITADHASDVDIVVAWVPPLFEWPDFASLLAGFNTAIFIYPVMIVGMVSIGLVMLYYGRADAYEYVRSAPWLLVVAAVGIIGVFVYYFVISAIFGAFV